VVAGIGNIYASEALFHARISPRLPGAETDRATGRAALAGDSPRCCPTAVACGSNRAVELWREQNGWVVLFWPGAGTPDYYEERLRVL